MSDKILDESVLEETEPMSTDEMIGHVVQDVILGNPPDQLADEFINEFVLQHRPETGQILSMLETPAETLVEVLKNVCGESYRVQLEALDSRGANFLETLKTEVRAKMTELANDTA